MNERKKPQSKLFYKAKILPRQKKTGSLKFCLNALYYLLMFQKMRILMLIKTGITLNCICQINLLKCTFVFFFTFLFYQKAVWNLLNSLFIYLLVWKLSRIVKLQHKTFSIQFSKIVCIKVMTTQPSDIPVDLC